MAEMYCPYCRALTNDRSLHCTSCQRLNPHNPLNASAGGWLVGLGVGSAFAALFGFVVYSVWPRWENFVETRGPAGGNHAEALALLVGAGIFLVTGFIAGKSFRDRFRP